MIIRRLLAFAFLASVMYAAPHHGGRRTVEFGRSGPCSTCGAAKPVTITCEGLDWRIYSPGTIPAVAATVCPAGSTYTWSY